MPLAQPPGEAHFGLGEAVVEIAGVGVKAHLAVVSLPYSDAFHVSVDPAECTETFRQAHVSAFEFFGGVPTRIAYDNTTIAGKLMLGPNRELTNAFLPLRCRYPFAHRFCRVARGNEKGHVENHVGYHRRNFLVPGPSFASFAARNHYLEECCTRELARVTRGHDDTKAERLGDDRAAVLGFPKTTFEARRVVHAKSSSLSRVRFDRNDYSVSTSYAHHDLFVIAGVDTLKIACDGALVATHPRHWGKERVFFDPLHYRALLERKPGAFAAAKPLEDCQWPGCFGLLRRRLAAEMGPGSTREFIKVLRLLERFTVEELTAGVQRACHLGTTSLEAITLIAQHRLERPVELFALDGHPHLHGVGVDSPDLTRYRELAIEVSA